MQRSRCAQVKVLASLEKARVDRERIEKLWSDYDTKQPQK